MNKLSIPYRGKIYTFNFASNWAELPKSIIPWLGQNIFNGAMLYRELIASHKGDDYLHTLKIDEQLQKLRITMLRKMCNITRWPFSKRNKAFYSMMADEVADVLHSLNFVFKSIEMKRPFGSFRFWFYKYYLPTEHLGNITAAEFHFAEIAFAKAIDGDQKALAELCAIVCRPKLHENTHNPNHPLYNGDVRTPFNRHAVPKRAKHFLALSNKVKYPILLWFAGCRAAIIENYPEVFSGTGSDAQSDGWLDVFRALAKDTLRFNEVANTRLSFLLWELAKLDQDHRRNELRKLNNR